MKKTYTRGRFATLNGVTLFTLRLYDRMGILKPAYTDENGYHLYTDDQSQQLLFIDLCVKSGFSLKEIKALQQEIHTSGEMLSLLQKIRRRIHQKQVEYSSCERMIDSMIYYHETSSQQKLDTPFCIEDIHYHGLISSPANYLLPKNAEYCHKFIHAAEDRLGHPMEFPLSFLLDPYAPDLDHMLLILRTHEVLDTDDFYDSGPCTVHCIKAIQSDVNNLQEKIQAFLQEIKTDFFLKGPLLLTPVQDYLFHRDEEASVYVAGIPVQPKNPPFSPE